MQIYKKLKFKPSELPENAIIHVISDSDIKSYHYFQTVSGNYKYEHSINIVNVKSEPFFFRGELFQNTTRGVDFSLRFISYSAKKFLPSHFVCTHYNQKLLVPVHAYTEAKVIVDYMSLAEAAPPNVANWAESLSNAMHDHIIDEFYADHSVGVQPFNFINAINEEKPIRSILIDGAPWFVGVDVAKALGYEQPRDAIYKRVDEEDKIVMTGKELRMQNAYDDNGAVCDNKTDKRRNGRICQNDRDDNDAVCDNKTDKRRNGRICQNAYDDNDAVFGIQRLTLINESGLYALIFGSELPSAKIFKRWVTSEVLPSLRKTGAYIITKQLKGGEQ